MLVRELDRLARLGLAVTAGLGATAGACAKGPPAEVPTLTSAAIEPSRFRFDPPDGARFVRTDRRRAEYAIVGSTARTIDEEELRWEIRVEAERGRRFLEHELKDVVIKRDGEVVAAGGADRAIAAELVLDAAGEIVELRGTEDAAARLRALAAPGKAWAAEQALTPERVADHIATPSVLLTGELRGRPTTPRASWTVTSPPGEPVTSRSVTVERHERCGTETCARLRVRVAVAPRVVADRAAALAASHIPSAGGDPTKLNVRSASHRVTGEVLVEPATMLVRSAALEEAGAVTVEGPAREQLTVELFGTLEVAYEYEPARAEPRQRRQAGQPATHEP